MTAANALAPDTTEALRAVVDAIFPELQADLEALVRIPGIAMEAFDQTHVEASAEAVAELLRAAGMPEVQILRAPRPDGKPGAPLSLIHI